MVRSVTGIGLGVVKHSWLVLATAAVVAGAGCASDPADSPGGDGSLVNKPGVVAAPTGSGGTGTPAGVAGNMPAGTGGKAPDVIGPDKTPDTTDTMTASGKVLPCGVSKLLKANCQSCHSNPTKMAAPMPLVTYDDLHRDYKVQFYTAHKGETMKMDALVKLRINDTGSPMPPGGGMSPADLTALNTWLDAGGTAGADADKTCDTGSVVIPGNNVADPLCAPQEGEQETCYEFPVHGGQTPDDGTKYSIVMGEHYEQFYYKVPWTSAVQATRFGAKFDNTAVLHHWLLYTTAAGEENNGTHQTVVGTTLGDTSALLAGWAVGGRDVCFPKHIGLELPPPGGMLQVQWHFYNSSGTPQDDATHIFVCTVPANTRPNTASMTWLGTENLSMPPGQMSEKTGSCPNDSGADIHVWAVWPHMHTLGRHMKSTVTHADTGMTDTVFDKPFDFNKQVHYPFETELILKPNDVITSTCTFDNITDAEVNYGPSTTQEMCYQFAFSYPAGALANGVISLTGASNTCWMFGE